MSEGGLMLEFGSAQKQFEENVRFMGPSGAQSDPEKYNLYAGLANLADGLSQLASQVSSLRNDVAEMRRRG